MSLSVINVTVTVRRDFWSGKKDILRDLSLAVEPKEVLGFLGPNGAGKTTTLKVMLGLISPTLGKATIDGLPASSARARERVGYLPERTHYPERLTAREFIRLHAALTGLVGLEAARAVDGAIELVGLTLDADRQMGHYSKGMLQRAGLAQALVGNPDILVLDEPMSGLDPIGRRDVRELLIQLKAAHKTVIFSTHILPDVDALCDRVAVLRGGRITKLTATDALLAESTRSHEVVVEMMSAAQLAEVRPLLSTSRARQNSITLTTDGVDRANTLLSILRQREIKVLSMTSGTHQLETLFEGEPS